MNALPKNIKLAVPTPKEDSQQKSPHRFTMQRSSSNLKKSISEIKEEIEELGSLPRDSHIRPERAQRGFEEPDDSRLPSHIITPNNLSSFMELLNYNSQSSEEEEELHHHQKLVPVRQPLDHRDKDSTQDFIRDAMATGKSEKDSKELRPAPKPGLRTPPKNWIQPTVAVADHPLCTFAPLVRIKPIKHSTRLTCTQPSPLDFSELTPLVGSAEQKPIKLRTDLPCEQEDITVLKASISKIMSPMVSPMRKLGKSPEYYAPGSDEQSDEEEADHRIRVNPQLGQVRAFRVQPEKKQRSATPDVVESILEDYLEEPVQVKKHSLRRTQLQGTPERLSFKQPLLLSPQLPEDLFGFEGSDLLFTDSKSASGIQ